MMEEKKGADPKLIVAIQMLSIGIILLTLGIAVLILSPLRTMASFLRLNSLLSTGGIILVGLAFAIGGYLRLKRVKKK
jgi:uncharacterized membrane protein